MSPAGYPSLPGRLARTQQPGASGLETEVVARLANVYEVMIAEPLKLGAGKLARHNAIQNAVVICAFADV
jgi:hypothetical protein